MEFRIKRICNAEHDTSRITGYRPQRPRHIERVESMKRLTLMLLTIFILNAYLNACSNKETSAPTNQCGVFQGFYRNQLDATNTLTVRNDCTFTDSYCGYDASFTVPSNSQTTLTVNGTNGAPGCLASISHVCAMSYDGDIYFDCGGAHFYIFLRQ